MKHGDSGSPHMLRMAERSPIRRQQEKGPKQLSMAQSEQQ
jgi:hypothetical protein